MILKIIQKALLIELLILFVVKESPVFCIPSAVKTSAKYVLLAGILYDLKNFCAAESQQMKSITGYEEKYVSGRYRYVKMKGDYPAPDSFKAYNKCLKKYLKNRWETIKISPLIMMYAVLMISVMGAQEYFGGGLGPYREPLHHKFYNYMADLLGLKEKYTKKDLIGGHSMTGFQEYYNQQKPIKKDVKPGGSTDNKLGVTKK